MLRLFLPLILENPHILCQSNGTINLFQLECYFFLPKQALKIVDETLTSIRIKNRNQQIKDMSIEKC